MSDSTLTLSYRRRSDYPVLTEEQKQFLCDVIDFLEESLDTYTGLWYSHQHYGELIDYENFYDHEEIGVIMASGTAPDDNHAYSPGHAYFTEIYDNVNKIPKYIREQAEGAGYSGIFGPLLEDIENIITVSRYIADGTTTYRFGTVEIIVQLMKNAMFSEEDLLESAEKTVIDRMVNDIK